MLAGAGVATQANAAAGWTDFGNITEFDQNPPGGPGNELLFIKAIVTTNPSGCGQFTGFYLTVTTDYQKRLLAMLMMAKAADRRVSVYVTGTCHTWGYAELQGLQIE